MVSAEIIFALVSFSLGQLGDGLNIFQGIYLVGLGWNEGAVGIALSLMGFTALLIQPFAGDLVDKTRADRRTFLSVAALLTAGSAMAVMFVHEGNVDHWVIWITKIVEGLSSSFIGPCIAALTLASFGPDHFDSVMATNILFGHIGSVVAAVLAGSIAYYRYPDIKSCFYVIAASAFLAVIFVRFLPRGNDAMGRGFRKSADQQQSTSLDGSETSNTQNVASNYYTVLADRKTLVICLTGFFFHFANANVLLVLGEIMGGDNDDGSASRSAIPLIGAAIVTAQATMSIATVFGGRMTEMGIGRKPMFVLALATLPLRCALILLWQESSNTYLMLTQILDGIGGGFFGLIHPYMVADISFGTGRFNVLMGLTGACFGLGATLSNLLGQYLVEYFGHSVSLFFSLVMSVIPLFLFAIAMPETMGIREASLESKLIGAKLPPSTQKEVMMVPPQTPYDALV